MLDIIFLTNGEPFADDHWEILFRRFPHAKRVSGVTGFLEAHLACAAASSTQYFYVVDADAVITANFNFDFVPRDTEQWPGVAENTCIHIWHSQNPVNGLVYGYGGVKLFSKAIFANYMATRETAIYVDMTCALGAPIIVHPELSNMTYYNYDPFTTWRSAFREATKLKSNILKNPDDFDSISRLHIWTTIGDLNQYGEYSIQGALDGASFKYLPIINSDQATGIINISAINDIEFLKELYKSAFNK